MLYLQKIFSLYGKVLVLVCNVEIFFVRSLTPESMAETFCGSPLYMAPEIIRNQKYDAKVKTTSLT